MEARTGAGAAADIQGGESVIGSEVEIMTSWDLALEVADAVGVDRLAPKSAGGPDRFAAARAVSEGLTVTPQKGTNVILISYTNHDPELATLVLQEFVNRYFTKHLEVHRSLGAFDFVTQQTDQIRGQLQQTEADLKKLKAEAGILSVEDSTSSISAGLTRGQEALSAAEANLAEQQAGSKRWKSFFPAMARISPKSIWVTRRRPAPVNSSVVQHYQAVVERLAGLRKSELELLAKYTPESDIVKSVREQIDTLDRERRDLEKKSPSLVASALGTDSSAQLDLMNEEVRLAAMQARTESFRAQFQTVQKNAARLADVGTQISQTRAEEGSGRSQL